MVNRINIANWAMTHPLKFRSSTDFAYVKVANNVLRIIRMASVGQDIFDHEQEELAVNITSYFEDVVSNIGLWKAFITKHKALYGKYLPFYDIDESDYYPDEVNEQDILYLIWSYFMEVKDGRFINPENISIAELAKRIYTYLNNEFEKVPINDELIKFIYDPKKLSDIYFIKHILIWLTVDSYLLRSYITEDLIEETYDKYSNRLHNADEGQINYLVNSLVSFESNIGPLAIHASEWFARMCEANGLTDIAADIQNIRMHKGRVFKTHRFCSSEVHFEDTEGNIISMLRSDFAELPESTLTSSKYMISSLISYKNEWHINGMTSWSDNDNIFEDEVKRLKDIELRTTLNIYSEMVKDNKGSFLLYFKNADELLKHITRYTKVDPKLQMPPESKSWNNITTFVEPDSNLTIAINRAACIKDSNNPFYNSQIADIEAINLLSDYEGISKNMIHYLLEHNLLPDARINSLHGAERGRQLVQENIDFIARYFRRHNY